MSECNGNCSSCGQKGGCDSPLKKLEQNKNSNIKKVIGIVSGKGGVGKSLTTACLATVFQSKGFKTGIIDGDITGASIPNIFGLDSGIASDGEYMIPAVTKTGIKAISINLLLETPDSPVVWRGSMLSNVLKQFWTDVRWDEIDYMFIDMPPGTGISVIANRRNCYCNISARFSIYDSKKSIQYGKANEHTNLRYCGKYELYRV